MRKGLRSLVQQRGEHVRRPARETLATDEHLHPPLRHRRHLLIGASLVVLALFLGVDCSRARQRIAAKLPHPQTRAVA